MSNKIEFGGVIDDICIASDHDSDFEQLSSKRARAAKSENPQPPTIKIPRQVIAETQAGAGLDLLLDQAEFSDSDAPAPAAKSTVQEAEEAAEAAEAAAPKSRRGGVRSGHVQVHTRVKRMLGMPPNGKVAEEDIDALRGEVTQWEGRDDSVRCTEMPELLNGYVNKFSGMSLVEMHRNLTAWIDFAATATARKRKCDKEVTAFDVEVEAYAQKLRFAPKSHSSDSEDSDSESSDSEDSDSESSDSEDSSSDEEIEVRSHKRQRMLAPEAKVKPVSHQRLVEAQLSTTRKDTEQALNKVAAFESLLQKQGRILHDIAGYVEYIHSKMPPKERRLASYEFIDARTKSIGERMKCIFDAQVHANRKMNEQHLETVAALNAIENQMISMEDTIDLTRDEVSRLPARPAAAAAQREVDKYAELQREKAESSDPEVFDLE